jgi:hypothetical protein
MGWGHCQFHMSFLEGSVLPANVSKCLAEKNAIFQEQIKAFSHGIAWIQIQAKKKKFSHSGNTDLHKIDPTSVIKQNTSWLEQLHFNYFSSLGWLNKERVDDCFIHAWEKEQTSSKLPSQSKQTQSPISTQSLELHANLKRAVFKL